MTLGKSGPGSTPNSVAVTVEYRGFTPSEELRHPVIRSAASTPPYPANIGGGVPVSILLRGGAEVLLGQMLGAPFWAIRIHPAPAVLIDLDGWNWGVKPGPRSAVAWRLAPRRKPRSLASSIAPVRTGPAIDDLEVFLEIAEYVIRLREHLVRLLP